MPHAPHVPEPVASPSSPGTATARFDPDGPRYRAYPTADRFVEAFGAAQYRAALRARQAGGAVGAAPLGVYVHLPFCAARCHHCACHKVVTRRHGQAADYLDALDAELALHAAEIGAGQPAAQVHLGGGTPLHLADAELARLAASLRRAFRMLPAADWSIEVDPRHADPGRVATLAALGFNRMTLGVQDLDAGVQHALHRVHGVDRVEALVAAARAAGMRSVGIDLMVGLPRQTPASFARTLAQVVALRPDRVALHGYQHQPHRFRAQRRIDAALLPGAQQGLLLRTQAAAAFADAGYQTIGPGHVALPGDALAVARRQGRLQRDLLGYTTQADGDLLGLGVSATGRVGACYAQNALGLSDWYDALRHGRFATARGLALTRDDLLRRAVIMALLCQGRVDVESIELAHLIDFRRAFATELAALAPLADGGLVVLAPDAVEVTPLGRHFVRAVAAVFDRPLQADRAREAWSRVL